MRAIPVYPKRNTLNAQGNESRAYWVIDAHKLSPRVSYSEEKCFINIQGESTGSKTLPVLKETVQLIQAHFQQSDLLKVIIHVKNISGYGIAGILEILTILQEAKQTGKKVSVNWIWDGEQTDLAHEVMNFSKLFKFPFLMVGKMH